MKVLILGNGFELDYGFETRYIDFVNSKEWQALYINNSSLCEYPDNLATFLYNETRSPYWCSLESSLAEYVNIKHHARDYRFVKEDHEFFNALVEALENFLQTAYYTEKTDSLAHLFISKLIRPNLLDKIFTFNYYPSFLYNSMNLEQSLNVEYVHNMWGEHIIVGVNEPCISEYSFLCKAYNPFLKTSIKRELEKASDVIIFGHSLNRIDSVYFVDYFKSLSNNCESSRNRKLTIITKDNSSISAIKASIGAMGIVVTDLQSYSNLDFIMTDNYNVDDFEEKCKVQKLFNRIINSY